MKIRPFYTVFMVFLISSCIQQKSTKTVFSENHGDTLRINVSDFGWNFNPQTVKKVGDKIIASQIYDGLIKYNPKNLNITPAIAKYWIFSDEGRKYTFFLRTNAYFHKNECFNTPSKTRKITARDFKYSFEKLCTYSETNKTLPLKMKEIVGAEDYFNTTKNLSPKQGIKGIEVINDSTLSISIYTASTLFINTLADLKLAVLAHEAVKKYGEEMIVGSGPFLLKQYPKNNDELILYRNDNYYFNDNKGYPLPFFDAIEISFVEGKDEEIELFEQNKIDLVFNVPARLVPPFLEIHKDDFNKENPVYVIEKDDSGGLKISYILRVSKLKNFSINRHNLIDLTRVYFENKNE